MKTLTIYALVLVVSATSSTLTQEAQRSHLAQSESAALKSTPKHRQDSLPTVEEISSVKRKAYHIYFKNKSRKAIDVAIRFQDEKGEWQLDGLTKLLPGEQKKMGETLEKTYYYYASNLNLKSVDKTAIKFPIQEKSRKKLPFLKEEIWECYDTEMCNIFTVLK